ncbi:hypothetical protein [Paraburkholderia sp. J63]|uniref:RraA family protein n=1 Tax=Paraburkholderia sp. J63 TaxID=2805434 RepID=UPI002ABE8D74|nr:hypothetical protein [Paraburkholderia sp. J63]
MTDQSESEFSSLAKKLQGVSVGTISLSLIKRGYRHCQIERIHPVTAASRFVGRARTLSTLPYREDKVADVQGERRSRNAHREIVNGTGPNDVIVVAARGVLHAAVIGDLLIECAKVNGAVAFVTDGAVRDTRNYPADFPVHAGATHTMTFRNVHAAAEINVPVACGEVLVEPGDLIVGDEDGVVVVPWKIAPEIVEASCEQEALDEFLKAKIAKGASLDDVAPPTEAVMAEYQKMNTR